jgi:hypothetical protein
MFDRTLFDRTVFDRNANTDSLGTQLRGSGDVKVGLVVQVFLYPVPIVGAGGLKAEPVTRQIMSAWLEGEGSVSPDELWLITRMAAGLSGRGGIAKNEAVFKTHFQPQLIRGAGGLADSLTYTRQFMTAGLSGSGKLSSSLIIRTAMAAALSGSGKASVDGRLKLLLNMKSRLSGTGDVQLRRLGSLDSDVLEFEGLNLLPGQTMIIDTDELDVVINNIQDVSSVTSDSVFFQLEPGENNISFATDAASSLNVTVIWNNRYL